MGFDLLGVAATSERGEYFRNNCWWWRKLWAYVYIKNTDVLTENDFQNGTMNNCHLISSRKAKKIAQTLESLLRSGRVKKDSEQLQKEIRKSKAYNKRKKLNVVDKDYDWNECYSFSVQNVREFAAFCKNSGGFEIG